MKRDRYRTYRLQVVVFFSFLALFSLIVAGIVIYGYRSNSEIMLQSSDELLYQISETIIRQTSNHLDPARKTGHLLRRMIERGDSFANSPEMIETLSLEALDLYPQFSAVYLGDEGGNFVMARRMTDGTYSTRIISRTGIPSGVIEIDRDHDLQIIATRSTSILNFDPRERPWYVLAKAEGRAVWSREYRLFTDQVPGITCAHPVYGPDGTYAGAVGIDFRLGELAEFLKSLKIGDSGLAFIADSEGNILAYPDKSGRDIDNIRSPRSPVQQSIKTGWINAALETYIMEKEKLRFTYEHGGDKYIASFRPFPDNFGRDWILGIIVPEEDFIGPIARIHETTLLFSFWLLIIGGFLTSTLARELTEPIKRITHEAEKIQKLNFEGEIDIKSPISEIYALSEAMNSMKKALGSFKKYVPSEIVLGLVNRHDEARLEAHTEEITLMFTDISNFSLIAEKVTPSQLMEQLSQYFDCIAALIHRHGGTIDKYIGDSVMAFWGVAVASSEQANQACRAALEIIRATGELNEKWRQEGKEVFATRIGINTGVSLVGNFGSSDRFNYTAIGDSVNLASRLEGLNKLYETQIIVSHSTAMAGGYEFIFRPLDIVAVKGRHGSVKVYQLLGLKDAADAEHLQNVATLSADALECYLSRDWRTSYEKFQKLLEILQEDPAAEMYMNRCRELHQNPPGPDWDGVFKVQNK